MSTTRKRQLLFSNDKREPGLLRTTTIRKGAPNTVNNVFPVTWKPPASRNGLQVTVSENHPEWFSRKTGSFMGDIGGEFSSVKTEIRCNPTPFSWTLRQKQDANTDILTEMFGYCVCAGPTLIGPYPPSLRSSNAVLDAWGAKAVAIAKPTNAPVDLSVTLGEMIGTGGLGLIPKAPRVIGSWFSRASDLIQFGSDTYLSSEFGWKPLAADVLGVADVISRAHALLVQYERDAGKVVRRSFSFDPVETSSTTTVATNASPYIGVAGGGTIENPTVRGEVIRIRKGTTKRWFSGAFTYQLPTGYSSRKAFDGMAAEANKLLGLQLTPETLWNLAPWTWAVDWFSTVGDVISNLTDWGTDSLVMRYGYLMEHTLNEDTYAWKGPTNYYRGSPAPASFFVRSESKVRRKANPFGFGLTWSGLSPRQLAIATALGVTRFS